MQIEEDLRVDAIRIGTSQLNALDLPEYWRQVVAILEFYRRRQYGAIVNDDLLDYLHPLYRYMLMNRFPIFFH